MTESDEVALEKIKVEVAKRTKAREVMLGNRYDEIEQETPDAKFRRLYQDPTCWDTGVR